MNRIVKDHYPAARLPAELREGLPVNAMVRVSVTLERPKETSESLRSELEQLRARLPVLRSGDEIDSHVRTIRDGGDLA